MLRLSTRLVSPTLLLCGAQDAKCYVGMSQESGCCPPVASHAEVSLSAERSPEMDSAFLVMGMTQWSGSALSHVSGNESLLLAQL